MIFIPRKKQDLPWLKSSQNFFKHVFLLGTTKCCYPWACKGEQWEQYEFMIPVVKQNRHDKDQNTPENKQHRNTHWGIHSAPLLPEVSGADAQG